MRRPTDSTGTGIKHHGRGSFVNDALAAFGLAQRLRGVRGLPFSLCVVVAEYISRLLIDVVGATITFENFGLVARDGLGLGQNIGKKTNSA